MSVKGQEFPAYDARGIQGIGLAYATSNRGGCHLRGYTVASEVLGIPVKTDPLTAEGKPELVKAFQDATAAFDSSGLCMFTTFAWGLADVQPQVAAACGDEFTLENVAMIGERIWNMERDFNNRAGFTAKDDALPQRLLTEAGQDRPGQGPGQQAARDAAQVLRAARLGQRRHAQARDARPAGPVSAGRAVARHATGGSRTALFLLEEPTMKHLILGAGPAGVIAAETIRKHAPHDEIVLVGDEPEAPYSRMAIPYLLIGNIGEDGTHLRHDGDHYAEAAHRRCSAAAPSGWTPRRARVQLDDGSALAFDRLLIATGSSPGHAADSRHRPAPACTPAGRWPMRAPSRRWPSPARACCRWAPASSAASSWRRWPRAA